LGSGNLFGGIEVCQRTLARHRHVAPHMRQDFGYCFDGKAARDVAAEGAAVHVLGGVRYSRPWTILAARRQLQRVLNAHDYDIVVCHELWVSGIASPVVRRAGLPIVLWLHAAHGSGGLWEAISRLTPPDFVIHNSFWTARQSEQFLPRVPSEVVYCPAESQPAVDDRTVVAIRRAFETPLDSVVVLQAGRMERCKGHAVLFEALSTLTDIPGWTCWQVGEPQQPGEQPYFAQIQALAQSLGIADRVRFLGWRSDMPAIRAAADIYCQPNVLPDSFGLVFIEALSAGLPVITSAIGGANEIVTPDCGRLTRPRDARSLAAQLRTLLTDPAARAGLKQHGPERARELCDPAQQVHRLADFLARALSASRAGEGYFSNPASHVSDRR
jgi:glycosyltransferase involved in cell wall biosynthesis